MGFRLRSVTEWWKQTIKSHYEKNYIPIGLAVRIDLLKNCSHATAWFRCEGPQNLEATLYWNRAIPVLGITRALSPHLRRFWSFTKIVEDGRKNDEKGMHCSQMKTARFLYNFHCIYIQNVICLFIIIIISSSQVNMWQNPSGCCWLPVIW